MMVVPTREAMAWHMGWGTSPTDASGVTRRRMERLLASRFPDPGLPSMGSVRSHIPKVWIQIETSGADPGKVFRQVERALSALESPVVTVEPAAGRDLPDLLPPILRNDDRVHLGPVHEAPGSWSFSPIGLRTTSLELTSADINDLVEHAIYQGGAHIHTGDGNAEAWSTRRRNMNANGLVPSTATASGKRWPSRGTHL
jgi:hypothetical protein